MLFCELFAILHRYCSDGNDSTDFIEILIDNLMVDPLTENDCTKEKNGEYNPISNLERSTKRSLVNGTRNISKKSAKFILSHLDKVKFSDFILSYSDDSRMAIVTALRPFYDGWIDTENVGNICAFIFEQILNELAGNVNQIQKIDSVNQAIIEKRILIAVRDGASISSKQVGLSADAFYNLILSMVDNDLLTNIPDPILFNNGLENYTLQEAILTQMGKKYVETL